MPPNAPRFFAQVSHVEIEVKNVELSFERTISKNRDGYAYLNIPKPIAAALGTTRVVLTVKDDRIEVSPKKLKKIDVEFVSV